MHEKSIPVYTDGSYIQHLYAGVGLYCPLIPKINFSYKIKASSSYECELKAIELALDKIMSKVLEQISFVIYTDWEAIKNPNITLNNKRDII